MEAHARVPESPRRLGEVELRGRIGQHDGAAVELQSHSRTPHALIQRGAIHSNAQRWIRPRNADRLDPLVCDPESDAVFAGPVDHVIVSGEEISDEE